MSEMHKRVRWVSIHFEHFLICISAATDCVSISAFASSVITHLGIASFAV